jgi:hypothetical protein
MWISGALFCQNYMFKRMDEKGTIYWFHPVRLCGSDEAEKDLPSCLKQLRRQLQRCLLARLWRAA